MATDNEQLVLSISADVRQIQRQLKGLVGQTERDTKAIEQAFTASGATVASSFDNVGAKSAKAFTTGKQAAEKFQGAMKASSFQTANLASQLNDIGVQIAGGQSPFQIAIQQGTQINQVLGGQGARGAVTALAGAFSSLVNPVGLATIATIALGGAAIQYFSEWLSDGKKTSAEIEKQAALVQKVADKYGVAVPALKQYADELKRAADEAERIEALTATKQNVTEGFAQTFENGTKAILTTVLALQDVNPLFAELAAKVASGAQTSDDFKIVIDALNKVFKETGSTAVQEAIAALERLQGVSEQTAKKLGTIDAGLKTVSLSIDQAKALAAQLTAQLLQLGPQGSTAVNQIAEALTKNLIPSFSTATRTIQGFIGTISQSLQDMGGTLDTTAALIRKFESFSPTAYYDVNAYRTGFGSDTTTRSDGSIEKVTKDTIVTLADAERDLGRRIVEFRAGIEKAIGVDTLKSLSDSQQAALTSIAYNYGRLPDSIVQAIKSGGGPEKVANAINALGGANGGVNKLRRKEEAEAYLSGTGYSLKDAGIDTSTAKKTPSQIFQGDLDQVERRIELLNAEYAAQSKLNPLVKDYGFQVEQAKIKQQLLNEAKKAGVEITPQLSAKIDELANYYAAASAARDQLTESQKRAADIARELNEVEREAIGGLISDLVKGEDASKALASALGKVADKLLDLGLNSIFDSLEKSGSGGILGTIGKFLGFGGARATGGPVNSAKTYLVGEKGPELFSPGRNGTIIPNNRLPSINPRDLNVASRGGRQGLDIRVAADVDNSGNITPFVTKVADDRANAATARGQQQAQRTFPAMQADRQRRYS